MLKKVITYTDYNGVTRTETFYFNLSRVEITEMEVSAEGGLDKHIEQMVAEQDHKRIIELVQLFILKSVGEKSPDGKRFIKSDEIRNAFAQTEAYTQLFMELASDADAAAAFLNGVIPAVPAKS